MLQTIRGFLVSVALVGLVALCATHNAVAQSGNTFPTPGGPRAPGAVAMCPKLDGNYVACSDAGALPASTDLRPTASTITARDIASSSASGFNSVSIVTGAPTAASYLAQQINGMSAVRVQVTGTWTGTLTFEASIDAGATWVAVPLRGTGTVYTGSTTTANGDFGGDISGLTNFRVRSTAAITGTANVAMTFSPSSGFVQVLNPVREVDNTSGAVATIKPASTAAAATDTGKVVALHPSSPLPAGELHVGETGFNVMSISVALVTSNNTVSTGKAIGPLITFAGAARVSGAVGAPGTGGLAQSIVATFKDAVGAMSADLYLFNASPSGSTCTDNTTFALVDADRDKVIDVTHITDFTAGNTAAIGKAQNLALPYSLSSATSLFGCLVARSSFAITGTANASVNLRAVRN